MPTETDAKQLDILPRQLQERIAAGERFHLLDIREPEEWAICQIKGSQLIAMGDVSGQLHDIPDDVPIVCICHHGIRSQSVQHFLLRNDFEEVYNLIGGIDRWSKEVDPTIPRY